MRHYSNSARAFGGVVVLIAALSAMATANTAVPEFIATNSGWTVALNEFFYDADAQATVFKYDVTVEDSFHDIGHFVIGAPGCSGVAVSGSDWDESSEFTPTTPTLDGTTSVTGYKWPWGQSTGTTTYTIVLDGEVGAVAAGNYGVSGGGRYTTGNVLTPSCDLGAGLYPVIDPVPATTRACEVLSPAGEFDVTGLTLVEEDFDAPKCFGQGVFQLTYAKDQTVNGIVYETRTRSTSTNIDNDAPTLVGADAILDITVECDDVASLEQPASLEATDACDQTSSVTVIPCISTITETECVDHYFMTNTWTATDECGNSVCHTQTITVTDTTPPNMFAVPDDATVDCDALLADPTLTQNPTGITATDNCREGDIPVTIETRTVDKECAGTYTIFRTFTAVDNCGNEQVKTQTVDVIDETPPVLSFDDTIGESRSAECLNLPQAETITASDVCGDIPIEVEYTQTPVDAETAKDYCSLTVDRRWFACDDCGNPVSLRRTILAKDTTAPTFTLTVLDDDTVECDSVPDDRDEPIVDDCDSTVDFASCEDQIDTSVCESQYVINRVCTATDACGNSRARTQVINVIDTVAPVFTTLPANVSVECDNVPAFVENLAVDAEVDGCPSPVTQTSTDSGETDECDYTITRTWTISDCALNSRTYTQEIDVTDSTDPTWDNVWSNYTQDCTVPEDPVTRTASDNCHDAPVTTTRSSNNACKGREVVTVVHTASDGCGNSIDYTQTLAAVDDTAPVYDLPLPSNINVSCEETFTIVPPTAQDECSDATVEVISDVTVNSTTCPHAYVRTIVYQAKDECDNRAEPVTVTITVFDATAPEFEPATLANANVSCDAIPCPEDVTVTDNCDGVTVSYTEEEVAAPMAQASCDFISTINRVWVSTDACGNQARLEQELIVFDDEAPVYTGESLPNEDVSCDATIVPPTDPLTNWTENCGGFEVILVISDPVTPIQCPQEESVTYTWTATDDCGNSDSVSKTFVGFDDKAPAFQEPQLENKDLSCEEIGNLDMFDTPTALDNCANAVTVANMLTFEDVGTGPTGTCPDNSVTRTWTAVDQCGNTNTTSQTISYTDDEAPTPQGGCPAALITGTCMDIPAAATLVWEDNCDDSPTTSFSETETPEADRPCLNTYNITRTWTATDHCCKVGTCTQTVVIVDDEFPEITTSDGQPIADVAADCGDIPKPPSTCAEDNCAPVTLKYTEVKDGPDDSCLGDYTLTRTWTATDECGHAVNETQVVTVTDSTDPVIVDAPAPTTIDCTTNPLVAPTVATPGCTDDCSTPVVTPNPSSDLTNVCSRVFTFEFTCDDGCGNTDSTSTTVTVNDVDTPTFAWTTGTAPAAEISFSCADDVTGPATATGVDDCTVATVTYSDDLPAGGLPEECSSTIVRTWTVEDECNHVDTFTQTVNVLPRDTPTWDTATGPADISIPCSESVPAGNPQTATDNCGKTYTADPVDSDPVPGCGLTSVTTRTWTIVDICGTTITRTQLITVEDRELPVIDLPEPNSPLSNQCTYPPIGAATATDECGQTASVTEGELQETIGSCVYAPLRVWTFTATDDCGNSSSDSVTEQYTWTKAPTANVVDGLGLTRDFSCDEAAVAPTVEWTDGCGEVIVTGAPAESVNTNVGCPQDSDITWTYSATDKCGIDGMPFDIVGEVRDTERVAVEFEWPVMDEQVECPFVSPAPAATATDNCGIATVELTEVRLGFDSDDCCNYEVIRIWVASDGCNTPVVTMQRVTIRDTIPPVWSGTPPQDITIECNETFTLPVITWSEAPFAVGYCAATPSTTACSPSPVTVPGAAIILDGTSFTLGADVRVVRWANNVTFVTGTFSDGTNTYDAVLQFEKRENDLSQSVFTDVLEASCYDTSANMPANPLTWRLFKEVSGNLTNQADASDKFTFSMGSVDGATVAQLGTGATGNTERYGLYSPLEFTHANGATGSGRVVIDLNTCDTSDWEFPELLCGPHIEDTLTNVTEGNCTGSFKTTYTWSAVDAAGNANSTQMVVTVVDSRAPTFVLPAGFQGVVNNDCVEPTAPVIDASDVCSEATVARLADTPIVIPNECAHRFSLVRTWTATDECQQVATLTQEVNVVDDEAPTFTFTPPSTTRVQCADLIPQPVAVTCTDNCAGDVPCTSSHSSVPTTNCAADGSAVSRTFTWTAEDECGNSDSVSYTRQALDTTAPVCGAGENCASRTIPRDCTEGMVTAPVVVFTDNCEGDIQVTAEVNTVSDSCPLEYTWTYTPVDSCGNAGTPFTVTNTHTDSTPPTINVPAERTAADCMSWDSPTGQEEVDSNAVTATDACGSATVEFVDDVPTYDNGCLKLITRNWLATDACGNTATASSTIIVNDVAGPTLEPASIANVDFDCNTDAPCAENVKADDMCPGITVAFEESSSVDAECVHNVVITRTYTFTDACGNPSVISYNASSADNEAPEWTTPEASRPSNVTVECDQAMPTYTAASMAASDDCTLTGLVEFDDDFEEDPECPNTGVTTYTWTATDECGKSIVWVATVTVVDTTAPVPTVAPSIVVECNDPNAAAFPGAVSSTDNCHTVTRETTPSSSGTPNCAFTEVLDYVFTDECGNEATGSQSRLTQDTLAPEIGAWPATLDFQCEEDAIELPSVTDQCTDDANIVTVDSAVRDPLVPGACPYPYTVTRTFTATDECNLSSTKQQVVTVTDDEAPVITFAAGELDTQNLACDGTATIPTPTVTDNCEDNIVAVTSDTITGQDGDCMRVRTITWDASDCSGNDAEQKTLTINYGDAVAPTITTVPQAPLECVSTVDPESTIPNASSLDSQCTGEQESVAPTSIQKINEDAACPDTFTLRVTYEDADSCGNLATATEDYDFMDTTPPSISGDFSPVNAECGDVVDPVVYTCSDDCTVTPSRTMTSVTSDDNADLDNCIHTYTVTETYTCTDRCGLTDSEQRVITYSDPEAPQFIDPVPNDMTVLTCDDEVPDEMPMATDVCTGDVTLTFNDETDQDATCPYKKTVTRTWTATDVCGQTNTTVQTYEFDDTQAPEFDLVPAETLTVECDNIPCAAKVTASDECVGISMTYGEVEEEGSCDGEVIVTRTWVAEDLCANTATFVQTITGEDTTPPEFVASSVPENVTVSCIDDLPDVVNPNATDNCAAAVSVVYNGETEVSSTDCALVLERSWTATDGCGNPTTIVQTITVVDDQPPLAGVDTCSCVEPVDGSIYAEFTMADINSVLTTFEDAEDSCGVDSNIDVEVIGCTSAQDEELGLETIDGAFTADCHIVEAGDMTKTLKVRMRASLLRPNGRLFEVALQGTDSCGNSANATRYVWVPLDGESDLAAEFGSDIAALTSGISGAAPCSESCIPVPTLDFCNMCECRYDVPYCPEVEDQTHSVSLQGTDEANGLTTLTYAVTVGAGVTFGSATFGIDVSSDKVEVVSVSAIGLGDSSYVSGVTVGDIFFAGSTSTVQVVLRGSYTGGNDVIMYELGAQDTTNLVCARGLTMGPGARAAADLASTDNICGHVGIYGSTSMMYTDSRVSMKGAGLELTLNGVVVSRTVTGSDGNYCFYGLDASETYEVSLIQEGSLSVTSSQTSQVQDYLRVMGSIDAFPLGEPVEATTSDDTDFRLFINAEHLVLGTPRFYESNSALNDFTGNPRSTGFWAAQFEAINPNCARRSVVAPEDVTEYANLLKDSILAQCFDAADDAVAVTADKLVNGSAEEMSLFAIALNHASGRGLFEPYRSVQALVVAYGAEEVCNGGTDPQTSNFLQQMLEAC